MRGRPSPCLAACAAACATDDCINSPDPPPLRVTPALVCSDKNGDGVLDKPELVAILSRGNGLHKFSEEVAGKVTDDILKVWGSDGKLTVEQIIEWLKMERAW